MSETPTPRTAPLIEDARKIGAEGGPTVEAERLAFEAWMEGHCWSLDDVFWTGEQYRGGAERGGIVDAYAVQIRGLWAAWRDRAALAADALTAEREARERAEDAANAATTGRYSAAMIEAAEARGSARALRLQVSILTAERDALRAEVERLREDAERYLWLRNKARTVDWSYWLEDGAYMRHCRIEADRMDAVIDAAIRAAKERS